MSARSRAETWLPSRKISAKSYAYATEEMPCLKVILETCLLTEDEKVTACLIAKEVGADFVKTSTGFNGPGATVEDVRLMRSVVGPNMGVKAAGGVRTYEDAMRMIEAGATRIGTSSGIKIIGEAAQQS